MKRVLYILGFLLLSFSWVQAQDDQGEEAGNGKLKERFREFMQNRLDLSKDEAEKTFPLFLDYMKQIRSANKEFPNDALKRRQRIIEVKIKFRDQIRETVKTRPERLDPDRVEKAAIEFGKIVREEAQKRNLPIRRRGGANNMIRSN